MKAGHWWFTLKILATWEDEIRKISVQVQQEKIVIGTPSSK
jgi:hypothetical protein